MRFVVDLWPENEPGVETPGEVVRWAISRIRDSGEHLAWEVRDDITDQKLFDVPPEQILQPLVESPVLLVYGDPAEGFHFIGPVTPNDPALDRFIDQELRSVTWWYLPLRTLADAKEDT